MVCLRGYLPEETISDFIHEFYRELFTGAASTPRAAFASAQRKQQESFAVGPLGGFVLLEAEGEGGGGGGAAAKIAVPGVGELRDLSPKFCPSNLPLLRDNERPDERASVPTHGGDGGGFGGFGGDDDGGGGEGGGEGVGEGGGEGVGDGAGLEMLAHGRTFVGRHLEIHKLVRSCLYNQLTVVYGDRGAGKSALILEAARYMRQRNRFPHGIFCCSLEGLRSMKAVRTRLGATLSIPARSSSDLFDLMARYSSCLLILDRCEDALRQRRTPFCGF